MYSFHLARPGVVRTLRALWCPPRANAVSGLRYAECLVPMQLGASIFSPRRWKANQLAMFAAWNHEDALDSFLATPGLGTVFADGWHVRLEFLRQWGSVSDLPTMRTSSDSRTQNPDDPVVAITLARLRLRQAKRFIRFGKPVERLVRDHTNPTLALAAARPVRTLSTFTVWRSLRAMLDMVHGANGGRMEHAAAMDERNRKDFHHEFTTLRFRCVSEHGRWVGRGDYASASAPTAPPLSPPDTTSSSRPS